jgi:opacity protein-like surface antigen
MKKALAGVLCALLLAGAAAFAEKPPQNVNPVRYPNLASAQKLCLEAFQKIGAAQQAKEGEMGGHAQKAKELLTQASEEIKLAALAAELNGR